MLHYWRMELMAKQQKLSICRREMLFHGMQLFQKREQPEQERLQYPSPSVDFAASRAYFSGDYSSVHHQRYPSLPLANPYIYVFIYNRKGQDVHIMPELLLNIFEEKWAVIEAEYNPDWRYEMVRYVGLLTPTSRKTHPFSCPPPEMRSLDRSKSMTMTVDSKLKQSNFAPVGRAPVLEKLKAKDPHKRDMTFEEKQRLSTNLQCLPSEKLDNIVQIIKNSNLALCQHDDEIEVDIDSVDAETLWELDWFVTNYKKSLSKNKRKA
ncbi:hypothetical protein F0562_023590 [Nyssa sinensis]|uniref:NET domain-containing protein n=1 Tax=Nyssa sinensis TaxID=561372 RepID=A0A5J5BGL7_9ASTE|nr:hypothetical protein F0562_023590 [Nyssa sinensis]